MWNLPPFPEEDSSEEEVAECTRKKQILEWWLCSYVPNAVGTDWWGDKIRPYYLMTDKFDVEGKQKVIVTVTSIAYALVNYENNVDKWTNIFKCKDKHGVKAKAPTYNKNVPETHQFKAKWSDANQGQGCGWDPAVFKVLNKCTEEEKAFRKQEEEDGYPLMRMGQAIIKVKMQIDESDSEPSKKKHKTGQEGDDDSSTEEDFEENVIVFEDE